MHARKIWCYFLLTLVNWVPHINAQPFENDMFEILCKRARKLDSLHAIRGNVVAGQVFYRSGRIVIQGVEGVFNPSEDGTWDWQWKGPENDKEWAWLMNRHRFLLFLVDAAEEGTEGAYPRANDMLIDWIRSNPAPSRWSYSLSWRALEAARRILGSWAPLLARDDIDYWVSPELENLWYQSLREHGNYLKKYHHFQGNHLITEMNALLLLSKLLQDTPDASDWREYALSRLTKELDKQFFSDGMHRELSNHYHRIALEGFLLAAEIAPEDIVENSKWRAAWQALRDITQPNGYGPLNNDGDLEYNRKILDENTKWWTDFGTIDGNGFYFRNPGPSGQFIARKRSQHLSWWLMADFGPYGADHQHEDRLHVSWAVNFQSILVDNGRFHYKDDAWRKYFRKQPSHNTIILEKGSYLQPEWGRKIGRESANDTRSGGTSDWAWAVAPKVFRTTLGIVVCHRTIISLDSGEIFIIDQRDSPFGGATKTHWNFHPNTQISSSSRESHWYFEADKVQGEMELLFPKQSDSKIYQGQESPFIAGWHAPNYNKKVPATQIRTEISSAHAVHVWRLSPRRDRPSQEVIHHMDGSVSLHWPQPSMETSIFIEKAGDAPQRYDSEP